MVLTMTSLQSAAAVRGRYEPRRVRTSTIAGEREGLSSIGSPQVAMASAWDDLRLIPVATASVVLAMP